MSFRRLDVLRRPSGYWRCGAAEPVRVRRLTDQEGQELQQIVRRGSAGSVGYRRAVMLLASAGGNRIPVIAKPVQADEDTVRDVIHRFNEIRLDCLDPRRAGGRPRLLNRDEEDFVIETAITRPTKLGQPFNRWSIREARFGPLRQFTVANSNHRNHAAQTLALHACLRWRNKNARHPDVLAAQRRERARIRSEKGLCWGARLVPQTAPAALTP
ncbi:helix-turn-helix domain-containing protein [Streptomyces sp. NPDC052299]|uniref:helix-turn-helix domain-containing protein n=1 Tax=Streptomyces sp. NPDC052299 TaxID=3155054 RepID=UPI003415A560